MEFDKSGNAILSEEEHMATGRMHQTKDKDGNNDPVPVPLLNPSAWERHLQNREAELLAKEAADDDELTHSERAQIQHDRADIVHDRGVVEAMGKQLTDRAIQELEELANS